MRGGVVCGGVVWASIGTSGVGGGGFRGVGGHHSILRASNIGGGESEVGGGVGHL